ncbi:unnamed protein product [Lymnaea stagnalis]|uniref:MutS protein homolog 5 n=1 Tax=Lymnaea stagnalis TaxID=6523 RepID=A0AAV2I6G0_LYMST
MMLSNRTIHYQDNLSELSYTVHQLRDEDEEIGNENLYDDAVSGGRRTQSETSGIESEVYASIVWQSGQLALAFYDLSSRQIFLVPDVPENDDFSTVKQILREIQPTIIVTSSLQDSRLISCLKRLISNQSPNEIGLNNESCRLEILTNADFSYDVGKRRILALTLPGMPKHFTEEEKKIYFSSLISLDRTNLIRAVGGLLKYLQKSRVGVELEDTDTQVPVFGFHIYTIENQIQIDTMTYWGLSIFNTELHPSVYKSGTSSKEGLSLFGILNRCKSSVGSRMLRGWFLRPLKNAALLNQRYDAISFFLKSCNIDTVKNLQECLKKIKYLPKILLKMTKAQATIGDWVALFKTIYHAVYIGNICKKQNQTIDIFKQISATFTDELHHCANLICRTIDFEESKLKKRFVVKPNVDDTLDEKKRTYNGLPDFLSNVAREELKCLSSNIEGCVVSYLPQIGYLLVITMPEGQNENDDHTIPGLEFKFASNKQLFYKSPKTMALDSLLGDTQVDIIEMEMNIMLGLQTAILENTQVLLNVMEKAAELDCLMALAICASEGAYVQPNLIQEEVIDIQSGRHPLQELCCSPYVPNDTKMGGQYSKIKLLTGPNACGKSVYLKQVAMIVFMAHIGSFVPAEQANIGPVDQIFSRIKSVDSVSVGMSTFLQDNMQMTEALRSATSKSLVIVDEYGKGTEPIDGLSLLTATIKFWIAKGLSCPLVLVSTHYHSIIQQKLLPKSRQIQFLTLETVMNEGQLVFLYQIKEGHTSSSYACNIAAQVGMPASVIQRGNEVSSLLSQYKAVPHMRDSQTIQQNERHEKIVEAFLRLDLDTDDIQAFVTGFVLPMLNKSTASDQQSSKTPQQSSDLPKRLAKPSMANNDQRETSMKEFSMNRPEPHELTRIAAHQSLTTSTDPFLMDHSLTGINRCSTVSNSLSSTVVNPVTSSNKQPLGSISSDKKSTSLNHVMTSSNQQPLWSLSSDKKSTTMNAVMTSSNQQPLWGPSSDKSTSMNPVMKSSNQQPLWGLSSDKSTTMNPVMKSSNQQPRWGLSSDKKSTTMNPVMTSSKKRPHGGLSSDRKSTTMNPVTTSRNKQPHEGLSSGNQIENPESKDKESTAVEVTPFSDVARKDLSTICDSQGSARRVTHVPGLSSKRTPPTSSTASPQSGNTSSVNTQDDSRATSEIQRKSQSSSSTPAANRAHRKLDLRFLFKAKKPKLEKTASFFHDDDPESQRYNMVSISAVKKEKLDQEGFLTTGSSTVPPEISETSEEQETPGCKQHISTELSTST